MLARPHSLRDSNSDSLSFTVKYAKTDLEVAKVPALLDVEE